MSQSDADRRTDIRDYLADWPYVPQYLQESLDHELIARHGEAILRRALNTGRIVCFVGSGISMAYGRIGWGDMVRRLLHDQGKSIGAEKKSPLISRLRETLAALDVATLSSARYPSVFQFGEQLAKAVQPRTDEGENSFRQRARQLLYDDSGHASVLFGDLDRDLRSLEPHRPGTADKTEETGPTLAERVLLDPSLLTREAIHTSSTPAGAREPAWADHFALTGEDFGLWRQQLEETFEPGSTRQRACDLMDAVDKDRVIGAAAVKANQAVRLWPLHRFVVPALLRLTANAPDLLQLAGGPANASLRPLFKHLPESRSHVVRSEAIPPERDPLMLLADGLLIGRFITTNYDLDLERLLRDRGFSITARRRTAPVVGQGSPGTSMTETNDALGAGARDTVFHADQALELVDFTVHNPDHALNVVHLHGRATNGDEMIVTERDYLERYLRKGDEADLVNIAISLAFGANPVLFVGSGMSEDDILRPLRQFVAERKSRADRRAVVLLPANGPRSKQIEEAISHYSRYGVFTVHFGYAQLVEAPPAGQSNKPLHDARELVEDPTDEALAHQGIRWLALAVEMCGMLDQFLKQLLGWLEPGQDEAVSLQDFNDAARGLVKLGPGRLGVQGAGKENWLTLLQRTQDPIRPIELRAIERLDGMLLAKAPKLSPILEQSLMGWALHVVVDAARHFCGVDLPATWLPWPGEHPPELPKSARPEDRDREGWMRLALSARAVLAELPSALTGLCLCAKLTEVRESWLAWKVRSEELPKPRPNGGPRWLLPKSANQPLLRKRVPILSRHPIALRSQEGGIVGARFEVPPGDRFLAHSPSQTFRSFNEAMKAARTGSRRTSLLARGPRDAGRRVFVLLATRGVGKGHFFEMLCMPHRIADFVQWSWPENNAATYCAHAAFNLSFCHEVVSVFDRLANLLVERAHLVFKPGPQDAPGPAELIWNAHLSLKNNRVGRLAKVLALYSEHAESAAARIVVAFNGFNFLFDERGFPKNAQLHRLVMALMGPASKRAPVDFLLVCTEPGFPRLFAPRPPTPDLTCPFVDEWSLEKPMPMEHLVPLGEGERRRRELESVSQRLGLLRDHRDLTEQAQSKRERRPDAVFFHVLRGARASTTIAKYFPEVALAIAAHPGEISGNNTCASVKAGDWIDHLDIPDAAGFQALQNILFDAATSDTEAAEVVASVPGAMRELAEQSSDGNHWWEKDKTQLKELFRRGPAQSARFADLVDADFTHLFHQLGRNRFLLTIMCAAATEASFQRGTSTLPATLKVDDITGWLRKTLAQRLGDSPAQRDDALIASVFDFYRERHEARAPLPARCEVGKRLANGAPPLADDLPDSFHNKVEKIPEIFASVMQGPLGWALQQHILWHLAVVGHPIEADVLAEAPKIQSASMQIVLLAASQLDSGYVPAPEDREKWRRKLTLRVLKETIDLLVHRCLVFRLQPVSLDVAEATIGGGNPTEQWDKDHLQRHREARLDAVTTEEAAADLAEASALVQDPPWRFALHRFVQRAIFRRLHSPFVEYPHVDQFSLSMWATQPDDLPRPNATAVRDIASLMAEWTGFPQSVPRVDRPSAYHTAFIEAFGRAHDNGAKSQVADSAPAREQRMSLPARMLRAAFGVVRSVYSVGVVSRYHETERAPGIPQAPEEGYFEQHRLQIRWLIQSAVTLRRRARRERAAGVDVAPTAESPFFAEEIVWLYNECGLLCLVEGRLEAAAGLFRRALRAAREIESSNERGALWSRIHLNLAIVDMERGHIRAARASLSSIRGTRDENPILRLLAHGLIGMTEHLAGNLDLAQRIYTEVIHDLEGYGQSRSIAIFSRQLGELYRMQGNGEAAAPAIERAIARATQGGHEDIRQLAKLSRVRLQIDRLKPDDVGNVQRSLDSIERYGYRMGMPRLIAEVAYARASYLLNLGETHHASTLAASSLEIATANDLRLRQVTALSLLAKTCDRRGMQTASAPLVARADELAASCEYTSVRVSASGGGSQRP